MPNIELLELNKPALWHPQTAKALSFPEHITKIVKQHMKLNLYMAKEEELKNDLGETGQMLAILME